MEQKWIIIIVICIFAFLSICYTVYREGKDGIIKKIENFFGGRRQVEHFQLNEGQSVGLTDFNLEKVGNNFITNSSFENGNNLGQFIESKGNNKIITYPNPGASSFVLRQILDNGTQETYYKIRVKLTPNKIYQLSFYCYDKNNIGNLIGFLDNNNNKVKFKMLSTPLADSNWLIYYYNFYFPYEDSGEVDILIGYNEKNNNLEERYITNVSLQEVLNEKFIPVTQNLRCYYNCFNKQSFTENSDILKDLSGNGFDWTVSRPGALRNKSIVLNGNTLSGPNAYLLQNSNKIKLDREFCLFFDIKGLQLLPQYDKSSEDNLNQDIVEGFNSINDEEVIPTTPPLDLDLSKHYLILNIPGNENNSVEIYLPKEYDNIILICGGVVFTTTVKIINAADHIYALNYNGNTIGLYMDEQEILKTECPNLYFNNNVIQINKDKDYKGQLFSFAYYNRVLSTFNVQVISSYLRKIHILGIEGEKITNNQDTNKTKSSGVIMSPEGQSVSMGAPTPPYEEEEEDNSTCPKMIYERGHYYILIPKNSYLCKKLGYYGIKDYGKTIETAKHIYETNFPECPLPDILDPKKHKPKLKNCPFIIHQDNPCNYFECKDVNWKNNKINNESCKKRIDTYCSINWKYDPACFCWRPEQISNPQCQKWRGQFEPKDKCNFSKHEITDHPDSKKWIRKDKIPCWNCNLTAPEVGQQPCSKES